MGKLFNMTKKRVKGQKLFVGAFVPHRIVYYFNLYSLWTGTSKNEIICDSLTDNFNKKIHKITIMDLLKRISIRAQQQWDIHKTVNAHKNIDEEFKEFIDDTRMTLTKKAVQKDHIDFIITQLIK